MKIIILHACDWTRVHGSTGQLTHRLDELCANCAQLGGSFPVAVLGRGDELGAQGLNHALLHLHMPNTRRHSLLLHLLPALMDSYA